MFSLLLLLSLVTGSTNPSAGSLQALSQKATNLEAQFQPISSENCQKYQIRSIDLPKIEGKKVNKLIYFQVKQILIDAQKDSIPIGLESTFRPCQEQIQLRAQNCPSSDVPADSCSPATEKPGESLHNYGMAVDFKCQGSPVFQLSPCYPWLQNEAAKLNFKQRPTEPWHWSLTGQ